MAANETKPEISVLAYGPHIAAATGAELISAYYGYDDEHLRDVTNHLRPHFLNGAKFKISNDNLGGDPYKGHDKFLRIRYSKPGKSTVEIQVDEGKELHFDFSRDVQEAFYGSTNYAYKVTELVQLAFDVFSCYEATNRMIKEYYGMQNRGAILGHPDPRPGHDKFIFIACTGYRLFMGKEGDKVKSEMVIEEQPRHDEL